MTHPGTSGTLGCRAALRRGDMQGAPRTLKPRRVLAVLALALAGCDGYDVRAHRARVELERGDLARAEQLVADARGPKADGVRAEIARRRAHLVELERRFAELDQRIEDLTHAEIRAELNELLANERDPLAQQAIRIARQDFEDAFAGRPRASFEVVTLQAGTGVDGTSEHQRSLARGRQAVGLAIEARAWARAWSGLELLETQDEYDNEELDALRATLLEGAAEEARVLFESAASLERDGTASDALTYLLRQAKRFPEAPEFAFFHDRFAAFDQREAAPDEVVEPSVRPSLSPEQRAALVRAFLDNDRETRDAAWTAMAAGSDTALLHAALEASAARARDVLEDSGVLERLAELAAWRERLDAQRTAALASIFDEDVYFYPYDPPEPPRKRSDYVRAQREVGELVEALRTIWESGPRVALKPRVVEAIGDLRWAHTRAEALGKPALGVVERAAPLPEYVVALGSLEGEVVGLREFAWTIREAERLARGRAVRAFNERAFERARDGVPEHGLAAIPDAEERTLVQLTNEYRVMFGLSRLAWNPRLQAASQGHSDYMRRTGHMGHEEVDPVRRTILDRMRLVGYMGRPAENCAQHPGGAGPTFEWWLLSSGHHRNLLLAWHREVGAARAGDWWTQDFGDGQEYMEALDE